MNQEFVVRKTPSLIDRLDENSTRFKLKISAILIRLKSSFKKPVRQPLLFVRNTMTSFLIKGFASRKDMGRYIRNSNGDLYDFGKNEGN